MPLRIEPVRAGLGEVGDESEVENDDAPQRRHEDVARLQVAVQLPCRVQDGDAGGELSEDVTDATEIERDRWPWLAFSRRRPQLHRRSLDEIA